MTYYKISSHETASYEISSSQMTAMMLQGATLFHTASFEFRQS